MVPFLSRVLEVGLFTEDIEDPYDGAWQWATSPATTVVLQGPSLTVCSGLPPTGGLAAALCSGFVTELIREGRVVGEWY